MTEFEKLQITDHSKDDGMTCERMKRNLARFFSLILPLSLPEMRGTAKISCSCRLRAAETPSAGRYETLRGADQPG
jgi:hypothetical protein